MNKKVFLSHSSKDKAFAIELRKVLEVQGITTWMDSRELCVGDFLTDEITNAINDTTHFILVLSDAALNSKWVDKEVKIALGQLDPLKVIALVFDDVGTVTVNRLIPKDLLRLTIKSFDEMMPQLFTALGEQLPNDWKGAEDVSRAVRYIKQISAEQGRPQALAKTVEMRDKIAKYIPDWGRAHFDSERLLIERLRQQSQLQLAFEKAQALLAQAQNVGPQAYQGADYDLAMAHKVMGTTLKLGGQAAPALSALITAQRLFETFEARGEKMSTVCLTEQADCLTDLGQLKKAVEKYKESIIRTRNIDYSRQVAIGKSQLANALRKQGEYQSAIIEYESGRNIFEQLNEPVTVASIWHLIGMVYQDAGDYEQTELAYRQSLDINTQHNSLAGQAMSLTQLGNLYGSNLNRLEEAITFYRQATVIDMQLGDLRGEGTDRNNIAVTLIKLKHYDRARTEILRAIECDSQFGHAAAPWTAFNILHQIETAKDTPKAAKSAWQKATQAYLAYRQQGGYAQSSSGKLAEAIVNLIEQDQSQEAISLLTKYAQSDEVPDWFKKIAAKMLLVVKGQNDPAFVDEVTDDFDLHYSCAAEIQFLIERLGGPS